MVKFLGVAVANVWTALCWQRCWDISRRGDYCWRGCVGGHQERCGRLGWSWQRSGGGGGYCGEVFIFEFFDEPVGDPALDSSRGFNQDAVVFAFDEFDAVTVMSFGGYASSTIVVIYPEVDGVNDGFGVWIVAIYGDELLRRGCNGWRLGRLGSGRVGRYFR